MDAHPPSPLGDGRYELREVIGEGGSARVWRAWDTVEGRDVAVKVALGEGRLLETRARRLAQEASALRALRHPGVVELLVDASDATPPYLVLEHLPGGTLEARVAGRRPVAPRLAVRWMVEVLAALEVAHRRGVVHRDVKPSNILLDASGRARLVDFGIARIDGELEATRTDAGVGSIMFMAPEQRLDARAVGPAADVYAVASTLYHLVTGATAVDLFAAEAASHRWSDVPAPLRPVLVRATRHAPGERPGSAAELARALADAAVHLDEAPVTTVRRAVPSAVARQASPPSAWIGSSLLVAVLVVAITAGLRAVLGPSPEPVDALVGPFPAEGGWSGIVDDGYGRLFVEGAPTAVRARLTSSLGVPGGTRALVGTFDPASGVLVVEDPGGARDRHRFVLTLEAGGRRLVGTAENLVTTSLHTVSLVRDGESPPTAGAGRGTQGSAREGRSP